MYKFYVQTKWWIIFLFPLSLETFIYLGSLHRFIENRKKKFFLLLPRFTNLEISSMHTWQYMRDPWHCLITQVENRYENWYDLFENRYAGRFSCDDIIWGIVINYSHMTKFSCSFLQLSIFTSFIMLLMIQA